MLPFYFEEGKMNLVINVLMIIAIIAFVGSVIHTLVKSQLNEVVRQSHDFNHERDSTM